MIFSLGSISGVGRVVIQATTLDDDLVLMPNGNGALQAQIADSTAVGGNDRGAGANDWQRSRAAATQVASGPTSVIGGGSQNAASGNSSVVAGGGANNASQTYAVISGGFANVASATHTAIAGGASNTASQTYATVGGGQLNTANAAHATVGGGNTNTASGLSSVVAGGGGNLASTSYATIGGGSNNTASGSYSYVGGGARAVADHYGEQAHASGRFAADGDAQRGDVGMRTVTTDAVTSFVTLDGGADAVGNRFTIAIGATYQFDIQVTGVQVGGAGAGDSKHWTFSGAITNKAGTTAVVATFTQPIAQYGSAGAAAWLCAAYASDASDCLAIAPTGELGKTIRWNATVRYTKTNHA